MNKTNNFPPVICITTTKSKDRLNNFINQSNLYNITNYNIYSFKPYNECNYSLNGEFIDKIQENSKGPVTSHIKALSIWYYSNDDEYVLVLEDDINLKTIEYWPFSWNEFFNMLPEDWECIQLCSIRDSYENIDISFRRRINSDWGCQAYLIKRSYIKKIIDKYYINSNTFNLNISNIEVYFEIDSNPELYNLFPTVENTLFEGMGKVYNFPLFTEDIENTTSTFYENTGLNQDHNHITSYEHIINWWKNKGQHTNIYQIFNKDYSKTIDIFLVKSDFGLEEYEYLISLLPENSKINLRTYSDEELLNINQTCDIIIYRIYGMYPEKFSKVLNNVKPKIMINLSDEFYHENNNAFNQLGSYAQLYLRNYHHKNYTYTSNTLHIPLGYCSGVVLSKDEPIKSINEKTYAWSWVGNFKSDRYEMIEQFKNIEKYFFSDHLSRSDVAAIYNNSIFVPCGRGNFTLDCWRLYEASSCGAIPVIVGSIEEIRETFKYEENPPWIFADNWEQAAITCKNLLNNKEILQNIQDKLLLWWNNRINKIKIKIKETLNNCKIPHIYKKDQFGEDWFSYPVLYKTMVDKAKNGSKFVEVGSWKGKSSAYMAVEIANSNKIIDFYCVDHWLGSNEHGYYQNLDTLYDTFKNNMSTLESFYKPLRMDSVDASYLFSDNSLDFVFIDGSHEYDDVKKDILAWLPKVKPGGVLAGHDYYLFDVPYNGVKKAVDELLNNFKTNEQCWIYEKK